MSADGGSSSQSDLVSRGRVYSTATIDVALKNPPCNDYFIIICNSIAGIYNTTKNIIVNRTSINKYFIVYNRSRV